MKHRLTHAGTNSPRYWLVWGALLVLLSLPVWAKQTHSQATSSKPAITFDRYYIVELQGQRCGYARTAARTSSDQLTFLTYVRITLRQLGQNMLVVLKSISRETPAGELISIDQTVFTNGTEIKKKAVVQGKELVVTSTLLGRQVVERFAIPADGFVTESSADNLIKPLLDKPGERLELTILSLEGGQTPFLPFSMEVIGPETISAYGQAVSAVKVAAKVTMGSFELPSFSWCDQEGPLATRANLGGFSLYLYAASEAQAKETQGAVDLTGVSTIVPKVSLKDPVRATRAVYRLKLKNSRGSMIDLPQTDMQRVLARGQDYLDVEVTRQDAKRFAAVTNQEPPQELSKYLQYSLYLDWRTPSVKAAAQTVPCDSDKPWDIALGLWRYVDRTIFIKNLEVYFDPASKVLASHQGDCTEHAVLLAALARAKGLPSRLVVGLTQVPRRTGRETIFGYHAWTEVWIDGLWVSLDAALQQAPVDVSHIALGVSAANSSEPLGNVVATGMVQIIGNLQIELLRQEQ